MKKAVCLFLILLQLGTLCACTKSDQSATDDAEALKAAFPAQYFSEPLIMEGFYDPIADTTSTITVDPTTSIEGIPIDNDTPLEEALTTAYPLQVLKDALGWTEYEEAFFYEDEQAIAWEQAHTLPNIVERFPCCVLRSSIAPSLYSDEFSPGGFYLVFRVQEGGYFYTFWQLSYHQMSQESTPYALVSSHYLPRFCQLQEFSSLIPGQSTFHDVRAIDPTASLSSGFYGTYPELRDNYLSHTILSDGSLLVISYQKKTAPNSKETLVVERLLLNPPNWKLRPSISLIPLSDLPPETLELQNPLPLPAADPAQLEAAFLSEVTTPVTPKLDGIAVDNAVAAEDALSTEYARADLEAFFGVHSLEEIRLFNSEQLESWLQQHSLPAVNGAFPIQLLRTVVSPCIYTEEPEAATLAYSVYPTKEGGRYYVFWEKLSDQEAAKSDSAYAVSSTIYLEKIPQSSDFSALVPGESTIEDVRAIDPAAEIAQIPYTSSYAAHFDVFSASLLQNGNLFVITYSPIVHPESNNLSYYLDYSNWVVDTLSIYGSDPDWTPLNPMLQCVLYEDLP